ncbi:hypothetical protein KP509_13G040700 [Ceratopteris richardii]|uniref:RING-type domain-containing protein n=1 Tax=Ceratopteris richardii TaxID=49495 RepID=A0A8T2TCZ6_CERRI|nr:hypothetical protein KP509_13G040700 [Ceratopteris richardii]
MSVQAQQLVSLEDYRTRSVFDADFPGTDSSAAFLISSRPHSNATLMDDSQQQHQVLIGAANTHRIVSQGSPELLPLQGLVLPNFTPVYQHPSATAMDRANLLHAVNPAGGTKRRRKESEDRACPPSHAQQGQVHSHQLGVDLNKALAPSFPAHAGAMVSTGLCLAFEDERSSVTSSRPSSISRCAQTSVSGEELAMQFSAQQEDLNQLLKVQAEQLRQAVEEKMQLHAKSLIASVEGEVSRKIREKETEMERVNRRNRDLEERVRQLSMEREVWQSKAKSNEAMVVVLRNNLQQAMVQAQHQSREPSRIEGCGDSEADDAASVYIDDNPPAQQSRALLMKTMMKNSHMNGNSELGVLPPVVHACRQCGVNESSVLLLPCLHLCLCVRCTQINLTSRCPVCNGLVSNSAEVLLS